MMNQDFCAPQVLRHICGRGNPDSWVKQVDLAFGLLDQRGCDR